MLVFLFMAGAGLSYGESVDRGEYSYFQLVREGRVTGYSRVKKTARDGENRLEERVYLPFRFFPRVIDRSFVRDRNGRVTAYEELVSFDGGGERTLLWRKDDRYIHLNDFGRFFFFNDRLAPPGRAWPLDPDSPGLLFDFFNGCLDGSGKGKSRQVKVFMPGFDCTVKTVTLTGEAEGLSITEPFLARARVKFGRLQSIELPDYGVIFRPVDRRPLLTGVSPPPGQGIPSAQAWNPKSERYQVREVTVTGRDGVILAGEMRIPPGPGSRPAFLLLPGTGPHDRTGGGLISTLAHHLACAGAVTLILDRRGVGKSTGSYSGADCEDLFRDADNGINFLARQPEVDPLRIGILGHSEGALMAARVARENSHVRGVLLMASPSRGMFPHVALEQALSLENGHKWDDAAIRAYLASLEVIRAALDEGRLFLDLDRERLFLGAISSYYRWPDPLEIARKLKMPVLILHGSDDAAVPLHHSYNLNLVLNQSGNQNTTLVVFTDTGHFFGKITSPGESYPRRQYVRVHPQVIKTLVEWIAETYYLPRPEGGDE